MVLYIVQDVPTLVGGGGWYFGLVYRYNKCVELRLRIENLEILGKSDSVYVQ